MSKRTEVLRKKFTPEEGVNLAELDNALKTLIIKNQKLIITNILGETNLISYDWLNSKKVASYIDAIKKDGYSEEELNQRVDEMQVEASAKKKKKETKKMSKKVSKSKAKSKKGARYNKFMYFKRVVNSIVEEGNVPTYASINAKANGHFCPSYMYSSKDAKSFLEDKIKQIKAVEVSGNVQNNNTLIVPQPLEIGSMSGNSELQKVSEDAAFYIAYLKDTIDYLAENSEEDADVTELDLAMASSEFGSCSEYLTSDDVVNYLKEKNTTLSVKRRVRLAYNLIEDMHKSGAMINFYSVLKAGNGKFSLDFIKQHESIQELINGYRA